MRGYLLQAVHGGFLLVIVNANVEWLLFQGDASEILDPSGLSCREQHRLSPLCIRGRRNVSETCSCGRCVGNRIDVQVNKASKTQHALQICLGNNILLL